MEDTAIRAKTLSYRFGDSGADALTDVSFAVAKGSVVGLAGPDGAGKTTLMRLLAGLLKPTRGQSRMLGFDPISQTDALRPRLGYMPQKFGLYEDLTVEENLTLYIRLRELPARQSAEQTAKLLAFTGLAPFTQRPAGKLSGGMKQKLGLACTLIGSPQILLLDEPSVGVDPLSRRELWEMVQALASDGMTILWATSYLDEAARCAETLLMDKGKILFQGKPEDAIGSVRGRTFELRGVSEGRRAVLREVWKDDRVMDSVIQGSGVRVLMRPDEQPPTPDILKASAQAAWQPAEPTLENAFIDLLGGIPRQSIPEASNKTPPAAAPAVEAEGLTRMFGTFAAASDIRFSVPNGTIFGLLGPNGAGKSTTFKMLCGLLAPTSGTARIRETDIRHQGPQARQKIGYMSQKFSLYGNLSVAQNLDFFAGIYGLHGRAAHESLARAVAAYGLKDFFETDAGSLPLGYKQRLALACATLHSPGVLFLDEPTSGVDPVARREFWMRINAFVETGVTVVVTTHFMEEAEYCDAMVLINRGRIIARGTPDEIKQLGASSENADPSMEDAFIHLIQNEKDSA